MINAVNANDQKNLTFRPNFESELLLSAVSAKLITGYIVKAPYQRKVYLSILIKQSHLYLLAE